MAMARLLEGLSVSLICVSIMSVDVCHGVFRVVMVISPHLPASIITMSLLKDSSLRAAGWFIGRLDLLSCDMVHTKRKNYGFTIAP